MTSFDCQDQNLKGDIKMAVLADYIEILGDNPQNISPVQGSAEVPLGDRDGKFNTSGRDSSGTALLLYSVKNLAGSAAVFVNNVKVGSITATPGGAFSTQMILMDSGKIKDGDNDIVLKNVTDPFVIKDVICFFHQKS
jgi:hypothetical protein